MNIKAIETIYKGYRFRSRTEARWAVFFDALRIRWEYEREGFEFNDGTRYLPDFWLPGINGTGVLVEVKGVDEFCDVAFAKAIQLTDEGRHNVLCLWGTPAATSYRLLTPALDGPGWDDRGVSFAPGWPASAVAAAVNAARGARFEFGESGAAR